ncbi:hypothetical protein LSH36_378g02051 [Paralvinella palmiformis]|uniref:non-specific protein-tyrosine kinase n=1 Tax=Paralvinella palmiformis TaxID=53620 RepID=A0AAD9JDP2_9ANNE|nr:hypothetical protein LSH36_378g02051 [Paralvinella palmiformis]
MGAIFIPDEINICSIEELFGVSVMERDGDLFQVILNRQSDPPEVLKFLSRDVALSFIALLNGYHRLRDDYLLPLCAHIQSPLQKELQEIGCHGPVSKKWAEERLRSLNSTDVALNYLLKQRSSSLKKYILAHIDTEKRISFYTIEVEFVQGQLRYRIGLEKEPIFSSIADLLKYYKNNDHDRIKLKMRIRPTEPLDKRLYLCREESVENPEQVKRSRQPKSHVLLVSEVLSDGKLGYGQFTEVYTGRWEKESTTCAIKRLRKESQHYLEDFMASIHKASFWSHATITTVHAICLSPTFRVLMEYGELGPLDKYLSRLKNKLDIYSLIMVTEQLGQSLLYLESCHNRSEKEPHEKCHGNIRARNVVVMDQKKGLLRIKLCDPGMIYAYNKQHHKLDAPENAERLPWIAPELYRNLSNMTIYSDRYAYGITMWEILSQGDRPFKDMDPADIKKIVSQGRSILQKPHEDCPDQIYNLMKSCWSFKRERRISAKEIVRDICNLLQSDYNTQAHSRVPQRWVQASSRELPLNGGTVEPRTISDKMNCLSHNGSYQYKSDTSSLTNGHCFSALDASESMSYASTTPLMQASNMSDSGQSQFTMMTHIQDSSGSDMSLRFEDTKHSPVTEGKSTLRRPFSDTPEMPEPKELLSHDKIICDYSKENALGDGHYGTVYKGFVYTNHGNLRPVAIKLLKMEVVTGEAEEFKKEFDIMTKLEHPRIVEIIGHCETPKFELVMEYVENGSLNKYLLKSRNDLLQQKLFRFGLEIAEGMEYLGSKMIVHRDLAARNILVTKECHMKISDFGLARVVEGDYYKLNSSKALPVLWTAPEGLMYKKYTTMSDVWSFGITMWEIFKYGETPNYENLDNLSKLTSLLNDGERLARPKDCPEHVYSGVLMKCWEFEDKKRISFAQIQTILAHCIHFSSAEK